MWGHPKDEPPIFEPDSLCNHSIVRSPRGCFVGIGQGSSDEVVLHVNDDERLGRNSFIDSTEKKGDSKGPDVRTELNEELVCRLLKPKAPAGSCIVPEVSVEELAIGCELKLPNILQTRWLQ